MDFSFLNYPVPLNSPFYVERFPLESLAYREIEKLGSLVRIKSPQKTGKSSFLIRILDHARKKNYSVVTIDFLEADKAVYHNSNEFLQWFCLKIAQGLQLAPQLSEYWHDIIGSKSSSTLYLQEYILKSRNAPIVLALNEVNLLFEYPKIAEDFFTLLRFWHEQAKQIPAFEKLRLVVVHSTEIYIPLKIHQSPFNVGLPLELPPFSLSQISELARRYGLFWNEEKESLQLKQMTGGHPYLVSIFLYHYCQNIQSFETLLREAPTQGGIYRDHLQIQWHTVQSYPDLLEGLKLLLITQKNETLDPYISSQLNRIGLINLKGNSCQISCELYRLYFAQQLCQKRTKDRSRVEQLEAENQALKAIVNIDSLTQIANRRYFEECLRNEWQRMTRQKSYLSLILLDLDDFKLYNDTYGHLKGDHCLQQVAQILSRSLKRAGDLVARFGGEEFALILPQTSLEGAINLAENIRQNIKALNLEHRYSRNPTKKVTVSIGLVSMIPQENYSLHQLIDWADQALYQSKNKGRNCTTYYSITADDSQVL